MSIGSRRSIGAVLRCAAIVIAATLANVPAAGSETVLRWASAGGALTFDPHGHDITPTWAIQFQIYEALTRVSNDVVLEPVLATAWKLVGPTTWEFTLRQGVRFHDGAPLTAGDVVFSLDRARAETSELADWRENTAKVEPVGDHTVRITTASPDLLLPVNLSRISIMSRAWAEHHDTAVPSRPNDPQQGYAARQANGTGPFRLAEFEPGGRIIMTRNPDWWGAGSHPVAIDRIVHDTISDPDQRLTALLAGKIDLLVDPPFSALERIRTTPGLKLEQTKEFRAIFLAPDLASAELRSSNTKGQNPFQDKRVRQAMYHAIDIERIRDDIMQGLAAPAGIIIQPGIGGYSPELDRRLPYDPERASRLLAEAGHADGFSVRLDCPNNRYVNDEAICRAVAEQLGRVGITVTVDAKPMNDHLAKVLNRKTDFYMLGWTQATYDSYIYFRDWYHSAGGNRYNATGYANPRVDKLISAIEAEMVTYARDALIEETWQIVLSDIVLLPLHHQVIVWAMRDELQLPVDPNAVPWFRIARFGEPG